MYSQRDPEWGGKNLGNSGLRMANQGCVTTGVADVFLLAGYPQITPGFLVDALSRLPKWGDGSTGYTKTGLLIWARLREVIPVEIKYEFSLDGSRKSKIIGGTWKGDQHWVVEVDGKTYNPYNAEEGIQGFRPSGSVRSFDVEQSKEKPAPTQKPAEVIADEVIAGKWGNGDQRKQALAAGGYNYDEIQAIVNLKAKSVPDTSLKPNDQIADEVIHGDWGNGEARKNALRVAGYDPAVIQAIVNAKIKK